MIVAASTVRALGRVMLALSAPGLFMACSGPAGKQEVVDDLALPAARVLREAFRIGGADVPTEEAFSREPQLTVDQDGFLYALHSNLGQIAVFDGSGRFVRWIGGGIGQGPGEFTSPGWMGFVGDTLWVRNLTPPRISWFLKDGSYIGGNPALVDVDYRTTMGIQGVSGLLDNGRAWLEPDGFIMPIEGSETRAPFVVGDRDMASRTTLFEWRAERGRLAGMTFEPISEPPFHDVAPDGGGIIVVDWSDGLPGEIRIRFLSPEGSTIRESRVSVRPVQIPQATKDSLIRAGRLQVEGARQQAIERGLPVAYAPVVPAVSEVMETVYLPTFQPPVQGVRAGLDGTTWLHLAGRAAESWIVLDQDSAPVFRVDLPDGARLREASRESVWATATDGLDVPYVIRWDIQ